MRHILKTIVFLFIMLASFSTFASKERWDKKEIVVWLCQNFEKYEKEVIDATKKWTNVVGIKFIIKKGFWKRRFANIEVCGEIYLSKRWEVKNYSFAQNTIWYNQEGIIKKSRILFNFWKYNWQRKRNKMKKVFLHELGHALGFEHRETYYSVMNRSSPHFRIFKKDKQIARKRYKHILKR